MLPVKSPRYRHNRRHRCRAIEMGHQEGVGEASRMGNQSSVGSEYPSRSTSRQPKRSNRLIHPVDLLGC